jgi:Sulfotransferase domain
MNISYRFVLGVGRSGTTFLSRLAGLTSTPVKIMTEPLVGVKGKREKGKVDASYCDPNNKKEIASFVEAIKSLHADNCFSENITKRIERDDKNSNVLLLKEVHSLLAFPMYAKELNAKSIVIVRDTSRVVDSYFYGHKKNKRTYLIEEYNFVKNYLNNKYPEPFALLDTALANTHPRILRYLHRPRFAVKELIRHICITEIISNFLTAWSNEDENVIRVEFEKLCQSPVGEMKTIFDFLGLEYDSETEEKTIEMTTGKQTNYYDTQKTSSAILAQNYKYLDTKQLGLVNSLINCM